MQAVSPSAPSTEEGGGAHAGVASQCPWELLLGIGIHEFDRLTNAVQQVWKLSNRGSEKLSHISEVTPPVSGEAEIQP